MSSFLGMDVNEYCTGCGEGVKNDMHRRLLQSEASQQVMPLWIHILNLEGQREDTKARQLVEAGVRMFRKCFTAYERCTKQISLLRNSISKVVAFFNTPESDDSNSGA